MTAPRIIEDRDRVAVLHLTDGNTLAIAESEWPPVSHGDDDKAARAWVKLTGLRVTIRTVHQTTATPGQ